MEAPGCLPRKELPMFPVLAMVLALLGGVWADAGCILDPGGRPSADEGCIIDPDGACANAGCIIDPDGSPSTDEGCIIDPSGGPCAGRQ